MRNLPLGSPHDTNLRAHKKKKEKKEKKLSRQTQTLHTGIRHCIATVNLTQMTSPYKPVIRYTDQQQKALEQDDVLCQSGIRLNTEIA